MPQMRIGELARRTGVGEATLRAWERRYGVLQPTRSAGGHRLYTEGDVQAVLHVQQLVAEGWNVGAAARRVAGARRQRARPALVAHRALPPADRYRERLWLALERFDAGAAGATLDAASASLDIDELLDDVVVPLVRRLNARRHADPARSARDSFAAQLLRTHLRCVAPADTLPRVRSAVTCTPEGEHVDLGLVVAVTSLEGHGFRVHDFGADVPVATINHVVAGIRPDLLAVVAHHREPAAAFLRDALLPRPVAVLLIGRGFNAADADPARRFALAPERVRDVAVALERLLTGAPDPA